MVDKSEGDDRSMSEILASIRKIVTDEERARRDADRRDSEAAPDDGVLELTPAMRADDVAGDAPLDLGDAATQVAPAADLSEAAIEAIVRRVIREELKGPIGVEISRKVKASIREEVKRALEEGEPLI
ncbi:MAG: hypothetical protein WD969_14880 [Paracoccaceae bacterium]